MKRLLILFVLLNLFLVYDAGFAYTIDGYAYLEGQTDHEGISVYLEEYIGVPGRAESVTAYVFIRFCAVNEISRQQMAWIDRNSNACVGDLLCGFYNGSGLYF